MRQSYRSNETGSSWQQAPTLRLWSLDVLALGLVTGGLLAGCFHNLEPDGDALTIERQLPSQATVGDPFTVDVTVTVNKALPAVAITDEFDGLTLASSSSGDLSVLQKDNAATLHGAITGPSAGTAAAYSYRLECPEPGDYPVVTGASAQGEPRAQTEATVTCRSGPS